MKFNQSTSCSRAVVAFTILNTRILTRKLNLSERVATIKNGLVTADTQFKRQLKKWKQYLMSYDNLASKCDSLVPTLSLFLFQILPIPIQIPFQAVGLVTQYANTMKLIRIYY